MELSSDNVDKIFADCMPTSPSDDGIVTVQGVICEVKFDEKKSEEYREDIESLLRQLPKQFFIDEGGGWSFLNACQSRDGTSWGEHMNMDQLFCLGMAIGVVKRPLGGVIPDSAMPGGVPYYVISLSADA